MQAMICQACKKQFYNLWLDDYFIDICFCPGPLKYYLIMSKFDLQGFVDMISLDQHESGFYHFYPMQIVSVTPNDELRVFSMAVDDVRKIYRVAKEEKAKAKEIFVAIDFPAQKDIDSDFVAIIHDKKDKFGIAALPYCKKTGQKRKMINESPTLTHIIKNYLHLTQQ